MLVLTTIFIDVSNSLPKTSYLKMIDVWLLFNLLQPFVVVLTHTYMDILRPEDEDQTRFDKKSVRNAKKLDSLRRFALIYNPIIVMIFVIIYWLIGLNHAGII